MSEQGEDESLNYISGLKSGDRLKPVVTIVVSWSPGKLDSLMHLQDLIDMPQWMQPLVDNNAIHVIQASELTDAQLAACRSSRGQVFGVIRDAKDPKALKKRIKDDPYFSHMETSAAEVIEAVAGIPVPTPDEKEKVNMCEAMVGLIENGRAELRKQLIESEKARKAAEARLEELEAKCAALTAQMASEPSGN